MTRTTFKVTFFIKRAALKKSGKMPIITRITINTETAQFSTKLEVADEQWDVIRCKVKGNSTESRQANSLLEDIKAKILTIYHQELGSGGKLTAERIKCLFFGKDESQETLLTMFTKHNDNVKRLIGIDVTQSTYNKYELAKRRITEFIRYKYNLSDITPKDLNLNFIRDYELFLRINCKLSNNVAAKMIMFLKKIITISFNNGSIPSNPFASFRIKLTKVDRGFLSTEELDILMKKKIEIQRLDQVRDVFLFCCWSGLSYIDIKNLKTSNIKSSDGNLWISTKRQKTGANVDVMLLDVPKRILEKYAHRLTNNAVLPVMSNQKMNAYLKELADICGIDRNMTFHLARQFTSSYLLKINYLQESKIA